MLVVIAAFGIHLVEPYFIVPKSTKTTHSELQCIFTDMHNGLKFHEIDERFFSFNQASIKGVTDKIVESVIQMEYGADVVRTVAYVSKQRMNAAITLANKMNVKLAELLERQRVWRQ